MKFLILITLLILPVITFAQNNVISADLIESHFATKNFVWNSGAEKNKNLITESASITTRSTSSPLEGAASFAIDGTSSGQTVCWNTKTIDSVYKDKNFQAQFYFSGDASLYKAYVKIGSNKITSDLTLTNEISSKEVNINFPSGDLSTSPVVCLETTSASAAAIKVDKVYLGPAFNLQNVSQSYFVGSAYFATTASCTWSRTNTALGAFSTTAACPGPTIESNTGPEVISTTDTDLPKITLSNLKAGTYRIVTQFTGFVGASFNIGSFTLSDGTNQSGYCSASESASGSDLIPCTLESTFTYSSSQSSVTFEIFGAAQSGSINIQNDIALLKTKVSIYYIPSSSQIAVNQNSAGWFVDANISGASPSLGASAVSSYAEITDASLSMTQNTGSASVQIPCSSTNASSGLTCSSGSEGVGVVFNAPEAGQYQVCGEFTHLYRLNATSTYVQTAFQFVETSNTSQTILQEGKSRTNSGFQIAAGSGVDHEHYAPISTCGTFNFASAGQKTIRLMYEQAVGGTILGSSILADSDASSGQRDIHITVEKMSGVQNAPVLVPYRVYALSSSCGAFSGGAGVQTNVTNLTVTVTSTGRPMVLTLVADGSANSSYLNYSSGGSGLQFFTKDGSNIAPFTNNTTTNQIPPGSFLAVDPSPTIGSHTYTFAYTNSTNNFNCQYVKMLAYEL